MLKKAVKKAWVYLEDTLSDSMALRLIYYRALHRVLHLNHPKSFTEKMQWLKVYYRPPILQQLADKFAVRDYVQRKIGSEALCRLYGAWDRPEEIPFDELPDQFVLKVNSGSHTNLFCRDKSCFDREGAVRQLRLWMSQNYYEQSREWVYRDIKPRVIAEEMLDDGTGVSPADYKFYCFGGEPDFIEVDIGRHEKLTITLLDMQWKPAAFTYFKRPPRAEPIPSPRNFEEMARFARILSAGFPFSRVDFYSIRGKTVFGEITWYPGGGLAPFQPLEWDLKLGDKIQLPEPRPEDPEYRGSDSYANEAASRGRREFLHDIVGS